MIRRFSAGVAPSDRTAAVILVFSAWLAFAEARAAIVAADNASNSAYGDGWSNGDNGGSGFGAWALSSSGGTGGFGGNFVGDPNAAGITSFGTTAFAQFANPSGSGAFANADRALSAALNVGDEFSFQWALNFDSGGGNKGFNLYTGGIGGSQVINVNMGGFPGDITINGTSTGLVYGTNPMTWSFSLTDPSTLSVSATPRATGSAAYAGTFTVTGAPDAFRFYSSDLTAGDQRQPYFNNFQVLSVPEPAAHVLAIGLVVPALFWLRRRLRNGQAG